MDMFVKKKEVYEKTKKIMERNFYMYISSFKSSHSFLVGTLCSRFGLIKRFRAAINRTRRNVLKLRNSRIKKALSPFFRPQTELEQREKR